MIHRKISNTSYGILLISKDDHGKRMVLCGKRRDTIPYTDFLLFNYHYHHLHRYFSLMTHEERHRLVTCDFDSLWNDLWVSHDCRAYTTKYKLCQYQFNQFKESGKLAEFIDQTTGVDTPSWEFPKGKKTHTESERECALREFEEETRIPGGDISILPLNCQVETFMGSNDKKYQTVYFIGSCEAPLPLPEMKVTESTLRPTTFSDEFQELKWMGIEEVKARFPYRRVRMVQRVFDLLTMPRLACRSLHAIQKILGRCSPVVA